MQKNNNLDENYLTIFSHNFDEKINCGNKNNRTCRFCGLSKNKTSFRNVSHAIPESIGNKNIICLEECDRCNKHFSEYIEVHFDKYTKPYRNIEQIKGKRKISSYKTKSKNSRADIHNNILQIKCNYKENIFFEDDVNKIVYIKYEVEPYIPEAVYKTFVKMALSIMPSDELKHFKKAIKWIMQKKHSNSLMKRLPIIISYAPIIQKTPSVVLLKRKINNYKHYPWIFIVGFGKLSYQIIVPNSELINNQVNDMVFTKILYNDYEEIQLQNFANCNTIKNELLLFSMTYEESELIQKFTS